MGMEIAHLALALGSSLTAGLNLYLTVLTLGLLQRYEVLMLPPEMQVLSHTWVLITAGALFVVEFFADKIPYVDTTWDFFHSFIRIPAGALLAAAAIGDVPQHLVWTAALVGGFVSFTAHGAKASTRVAVNSTPEPFTNWALSLSEDILSLGVLWLVTTYPTAALFVIILLILGMALVLALLYRFFRRLFRRQRVSVADA